MLPPIVPENLAKVYAEQMAKPDLVFITKENQDAIKAEAKKKFEECNHDEHWGAWQRVAGSESEDGKKFKLVRLCGGCSANQYGQAEVQGAETDQGNNGGLRPDGSCLSPVVPS